MPTLAEVPDVRATRAWAWTREDCRQLETAGLLPPRWELVRGEIVPKMGQNSPHVRSIRSLYVCLMRVLGEDFALSQGSIDVSPADNPTSEPMPDFGRADCALAKLGGESAAEHIILLVEVSDSTVSYDLKVKAPLYAAAGIPEYWALDINRRQMHVHTEPAGGAYRHVRILEASDIVPIPGSPGATALVAQFLD